jgi:predicted metal-dependent phosphoesterase TrpH
LSKLEKIGISLKDKSFVENAENTAIGRLHFAKALIKEGHALNIQDAFYKYLSFDRPAFVPKFSFTPAQAIKLILSFGGIPVIAHPYYIPYDDKEMFQSFIKYGLMGIEVWHTKHPRGVTDKLIDIAQEFDLLMSGGSDCHGPYKNERAIMGKIKVPYEIVEQFKNKAKALKQL